MIIAQAALPLTKVFTKIVPTLVTCVAQVITLVLLNRIIVSGVEISMLIPFIGAILPLALVFIGIFYYKEKASVKKIVMLLGAFLLIAFANFL